jgi:hypothetical protein
MRILRTIGGVLAGCLGLLGAAYALLVRGRLTLDLGWGRSFHQVGPLRCRIAAPREVVFEVIAAPYLGRAPRALREKVEVLERSDAMVLAAHRTPVAGSVTTTVETVRFSPSHRVDFRHVRGPVPHVVESFLLREVDGGTEVVYRGELGIDLWAAGRGWGRRLVPIWERIVEGSLREVRAAAEARAAARARRSEG